VEDGAGSGSDRETFRDNGVKAIGGSKDVRVIQGDQEGDFSIRPMSGGWMK
jgi:hypothetical protein